MSLKTTATVEDLYRVPENGKAELVTEAGLYSDHLHRHWWNLEQHPELAAAFSEVVTANEPVELRLALAFKLYGMGLIQMQGNQVTPRCDLYRQYFRDRLRVTGWTQHRNINIRWGAVCRRVLPAT